MNLNLTLITYFVMAIVSNPANPFIFDAYLEQSIDSGVADGTFWFFLDVFLETCVSGSYRNRIMKCVT